MGVSFQFVELKPVEALTNGEVDPRATPISSDLWYPLTSKSSAVESLVSAVGLALFLVLGL